MPEGYDRASEFTAFEWLDDDRLALMAYVGQVGFDAGSSDIGRSRAGYGDILVCRVSTGRCDLTVEWTGTVRIAPYIGLPG